MVRRYTLGGVVKTFSHKGMRELYETGKSGLVPPALVARCKLRLAALDQAPGLAALDVPGFNFHALKGFNSGRHSIHFNGPWAITFEWRSPDVYRVNLEQYH